VSSLLILDHDCVNYTLELERVAQVLESLYLLMVRQEASLSRKN